MTSTELPTPRNFPKKKSLDRSSSASGRQLSMKMSNQHPASVAAFSATWQLPQFSPRRPLKNPSLGREKPTTLVQHERHQMLVGEGDKGHPIHGEGYKASWERTELIYIT